MRRRNRARGRDLGLLGFDPRGFNRDANRLLQGWTAATADLWVSTSRAYGEVWVKATDSASAQAADRQRRDKYSSEQYGDAVFELLVAGWRTATAASTVARSALARFFEVSRT